MPDTSRRPSTVYEERIDFEKIGMEQNIRASQMAEELRTHLRRIQDQVLPWVKENLGQKKLKTAINKFELPLQPKYREIVRRRMTMAANAGLRDVAREHDLPVRKLKVPELSRVRARADALADDHINRLTSDLRKAWSQAMFGKVDKAQLEYVTRQVFADFAGWHPPEGP